MSPACLSRPTPRSKLAPINTRAWARALRGFGPDLIHAVNPFVLGGASVLSTRRRWTSPWWPPTTRTSPTYARFYGLGLFDRAGSLVDQDLHNRAADQPMHLRGDARVPVEEGVERLHLWPQGVDARRFHPDKFSKEWRVRLAGRSPGGQAVALRRTPRSREGHREPQGSLSARSRSAARHRRGRTRAQGSGKGVREYADGL